MNTFSINILLFLFSILFFAFPNSVLAQQSKFYQLSLSYTQGKLELKSITVLPGTISQIPKEGEYKLELLSISGSSLYVNRFKTPSSYIHGEEIDSQTGRFVTKTIKKDEVGIYLSVPYFSNGKQINVYGQNGTKVLEIPVIAFAEVTPTPIAPTPQYKVTKLEKGISMPWIIGGGILFILFISAGVFVYPRFKKPQNLLQ